jgi:hypothetical protein
MQLIKPRLGLMVPVVSQEQHIESLVIGGSTFGVPRGRERPRREECEGEQQGVLHKVGTTTSAVIRSVRKEVDAESSKTTTQK